MLYRAHVAAGITAGACATVAANSAGLVNSPAESLFLLGLWVAFSLAPDLDVASVAQRWFYRGLFAVLVILMATGRPAEAAFIGTAGILPLVHHHRGWMHTYWAAFAVPLAAIALWDVYWRLLSPGDALSAATLTSFLLNVMAHRAAYWAAMVGGYATHLLIDRRIPRMLRLGRSL